jgi:uncharacterized protein (DUF983 family)
LGTALWRGVRGNCPACGQGKLFAGFLRVAPECTECHAPLGQLRADDLPPYITIMIVGHLIVPMMLLFERAASPELWIHTAIWVPLTLALTLGLIRPVKGATVGLMLRLGMLRQGSDA